MATDKELLDLAEKAVPGATPSKDAELEQLAEAATPNGATPLGAREEPPAATAEPLQLDQPIAESPAVAAQPAPQPISVPAPAAPPGPPPLPGGGRPSMASAGAAIDQAAQAGFDKAAAQEAVGKAKGAALEGAAAQADKETALRRQQAIELDAMTRAQAEAQQRVQAEAHDAERSFRDFKLHDYFKSQTAGEQLRANIFIGLGAAGQALAGGDNPALEKLKMIVDQDFKVQQLDLQKRERFAELKQKGATNLATQFQHDLGLLKLKQAAALDAVAAEAKAQAIRNGMPVEAAENNVIVAGTKQAALEKRAEGQEHLQASAATQAMAGAHLALARETAAATEEQRKTARDDKLESTTVRDEKGKPTGHVPTGRGGAQGFATRDADYSRAIDQLQGILDDIDKNGSRPMTPAAIKERNAKYADAAVALGTVSPLGKTNETIALEKESIGGSGTGLVGFIAGANRKAVADKLAQVIRQRQNYRAETLIPLEKSSPSASAKASKPAPTPKGNGVHMRLKDGRTGLVYPGGVFVQDDATDDEGEAASP